MRAVLQVVRRASVEVDGQVVGAIDRSGIVALVGVTHDDTVVEARALARKLHELRVLDDERSCSDVDAPLLVISQFTLYADVRKGRRPSWNGAAPREVAEPLVDEVVAELRRRGATVATGVFGADMQVTLTNDGPRTLILEV